MLKNGWKERVDIMAICMYCGKEFQPKDKRYNKVCSFSCAGKLKYKTESTESIFAKKFNEKYKDKFEYAGGYSGSEGAFKRRCLVCGEVTGATAQCIRQGHSADICLNCVRIKREIEKDNKQRERDEIRAERKALIQSKEVERLRERKEKCISTCIECGNTFKGERVGLKYCSDKCKRKHNNRYHEIARREKIKRNGNVDYTISLQRLVRRDKYICHICKQIVDMEADTNADTYGSIDHVIPINKGGTHTWDNVKLAHRKCNTLKSDSGAYEVRNGQFKMCL